MGILLYLASFKLSRGGLGGWVVGKSDFNENPKSDFDFDFDLGFVNIPNTKVVSILGGYETCFGIGLDPKNIRWESKRTEKHSIQNFFNHIKLSNNHKLEADIL